MYGSFSGPVRCAAKSEATARRPASSSSLGSANWISLYSRPLDLSYLSAASQYEPGSSSVLVAALALDVIALGAGRLPTGAGKKNYRKLSAASANNLQKQIRRAQARLSSAERKQRTRRLILLGSYLEHVTGEDPGKRDRLIKGLDVFLERDRDRQLFDLPHKENEEWQPQLNPPQMPSIKL